MEQASMDYVSYLNNLHIDKELIPIIINIEDMLARLDEFESLLNSIKTDSTHVMIDYMGHIVSYKNNFNELCERVDKLERFVDHVNDAVNSMETVVTIAELELEIADYSLISLLRKPLFKKSNNSIDSNLNDNGDFQWPEIVKTNDFFIAELK